MYKICFAVLFPPFSFRSSLAAWRPHSLQKNYILYAEHNIFNANNLSREDSYSIKYNQKLSKKWKQKE